MFIFVNTKHNIYNMSKINILSAACLSGLSFLLASCSSTSETSVSEKVMVDQCGYLPGSPKVAFVADKAKNFAIVNEAGEKLYEGKVATAQFYAESNQYVHRIDFSSFKETGVFQVVVDDTLASVPFPINHSVYSDLVKSSVRALYYNRSGMAIDGEHGGKWTRNAGHPDTCVLVHKSAASKARPEGTVISSPRGWYDAGDYNKYIVNSGITTYTMLLACTQYGELAKKVNLNIPESGNFIPDILDETLYNLRWMLTMQDPNDGGVYHKLTTLSFESFIMPDQCKQQRYVVAKGTAATLDFAAVMAYAARHIGACGQEGELVSLADSCRKAAVYAYEWALKNPKVAFRNPEDVSTGEYGDGEFSDEWLWASTEMYLLTDDAKYASKAASFGVSEVSIPSWGYVAPLGYYSMALEEKEYTDANARKVVIDFADELVSQASVSPIAISMQKFDWGSNSTVANTGMAKLIAYRLTGEKKYYDSALDDLHYLLGRNPLNRSFVTGAGVYPPLHIHHRPSEADGIEDPIPGFLCGGPNTVVPTDCNPIVPRSQYPALAYSDVMCSYSTNEIAINWNAPLVFLVWGIENL